jgi:DNA-binding ferritin-like protein
MDKVIVNLVKLQNQIRILHWQTESYAQHKALDKFYEKIGDLIDTLVEVHQGKYGRIKFETPVELNLVNIDEISIMDVLQEFNQYLVTRFDEYVDSEKDSDCTNIRDEILAEVNRLRYLLTLK